MKARAIKTKEGWYLSDLPGFDDIKAETIEVEVTLSAEEASSRTYKELRGIAIMERFMEKEARSTLKASKSMTVTSNKITPALAALLNELRDECTATMGKNS